MHECVGKEFPRWRPIQCLLSLSDTGQNKNEGGFEACLGFHRQFRAYFDSKSKVRSVSDYTAVRDKSLRLEHVSLSAGDAVFWDQRVIHANAVCNESKRPRKQVVFLVLFDTGSSCVEHRVGQSDFAEDVVVTKLR